MVYRGADQPDMSVINPESDVWQHIKVRSGSIDISCPDADKPRRLISNDSDPSELHRSSTPDTIRLDLVRCPLDRRRGTERPDALQRVEWSLEAIRTRRRGRIDRGRWRDELVGTRLDRRDAREWTVPSKAAASTAHLTAPPLTGPSSCSLQLRLFSRDQPLTLASSLFTYPLDSEPLVLSIFDSSLLVYTSDNTFYHFLIRHPKGGSPKLRLCGSIGFEGVVKDPTKVRGVSWLVPKSQQRKRD